MPFKSNPDIIKNVENPAPVPSPNHYGTVWRSDCLNLVPTSPRGQLPERLCSDFCYCLPAFTSPNANIKSYGTWFFEWFNPTFTLQKNNADVEAINPAWINNSFENPNLYVITLDWDDIFTRLGTGQYRIKGTVSDVDAFSICWRLKEYDCDIVDNHTYIESSVKGVISDPFNKSQQFSFTETNPLQSFWWLESKCIVENYDFNTNTYLTSAGGQNTLDSNEREHSSNFDKAYALLLKSEGIDGDLLDLIFSQLVEFKVYDFNKINTHTINGLEFRREGAPEFDATGFHTYTSFLKNARLPIREIVRSNKHVSRSYI